MPDEQKRGTDTGGRGPGGQRWSPGPAATGSELTSDGSSVITDSDVATAEDIPETEEILAHDERLRRGEDLPYMHAGAAGGARTVDEVEQESEEERRPRAMEEEGAWEEG